MAWPVVGRAFSPAAFKDYVNGLKWDGGFRPQFLALHNTAAPSLAQRPDGLTFKHIKNLEAYYRDQRNWNGGPHLFIDDKQIWVFNDLTKIGVHSPSWNRVALGIEMLGDFDKESFCEGRGAKVRANTVAAMAALNNKLGLKADGFRFHIEDKASNHACPGKLARAEREALVAEIEAAMAAMAADAPLVSEAPKSVAPTEAPAPVTGKEIKAEGSGSFSSIDRALAALGLPTLATIIGWIMDFFGFFKGTFDALKTFVADHKEQALLICLMVALGVIAILLYGRFRLLLAARQGRYVTEKRAGKAA